MDNNYSFKTTLVERERYVKELWKVYHQICDSVNDSGWFKYFKDYFKPKMIPIQRVVKAPKIKSFRYNPPLQAYYIKTDRSFKKVEKAYLLTLPTTLY